MEDADKNSKSLVLITRVYGLVTAQGYNSGESLESGTTVTIVVSHYQKATEPATTAASQSTTAAVKTTAASGSNTAQ